MGFISEVIVRARRWALLRNWIRIAASSVLARLSVVAPLAVMGGCVHVEPVNEASRLALVTGAPGAWKVGGAQPGMLIAEFERQTLGDYVCRRGDISYQCDDRAARGLSINVGHHEGTIFDIYCGLGSFERDDKMMCVPFMSSLAELERRYGEPGRRRPGFCLTKGESDGRDFVGWANGQQVLILKTVGFEDGDIFVTLLLTRADPVEKVDEAVPDPLGN